jgi:hypothetical protein
MLNSSQVNSLPQTNLVKFVGPKHGVVRATLHSSRMHGKRPFCASHNEKCLKLMAVSQVMHELSH